MKFHETHFEEYILSNKRENMHPRLDKVLQKFPASVHELKNVIFYGPSGVGKYTQMLKAVKRYSPSELKYEKKTSVTYNKQPYFFKISDIHYEIDMSLLGCNSKLLWHEIYQQIVDIVSAKQDKVGIIVCKYFHEIHSELLDNFYSYMQQNYQQSIVLKYFIVTEHISFLPDNILNCCEVIPVARPSKAAYKKCGNKIPANLPLDNISNIKNLNLNLNLDASSNLLLGSSLVGSSLVGSSVASLDNELMQNYKIICDKILSNILHMDQIHFSKFRDILYDILIYNLNVTDCIGYILSTLIREKKIPEADMSRVLVKTYTFFQYYNNNYRPIYHLENYFYFLIQVIHGL